MKIMGLNEEKGGLILSNKQINKSELAVKYGVMMISSGSHATSVKFTLAIVSALMAVLFFV